MQLMFVGGWNNNAAAAMTAQHNNKKTTGTTGFKMVLMAMSDDDQLQEEATTTGRRETQQQSRWHCQWMRKMLWQQLLWRLCTSLSSTDLVKGGYEGMTMRTRIREATTTSMTVPHTTISHRKEGRKWRL